MSTKPTILIIPGSFAPARLYDPFLSLLHGLGFPALVEELPTADRRPPSPAATMYDDAKFFNQVINRLLAEGKDVVVLGHSYGGCVTTEAVKGLTEQKKQGKATLGEGGDGRGRLVGLVYLTALMPLIGDSLMGMFEGQSDLAFIGFEVCSSSALLTTLST